MLVLKRIIIILLAIFICLPSVYAKKKKPKSGKIRDGIFTDSKYKFQLTIPDKWSAKTQKDKSNYRLILLQKNYEIPSIYMDVPDYTLIPRISVYVCESPMSPFQFLDSLISDSYSSDLKKDIYKEFEILNYRSVGDGTKREKTTSRPRGTLNFNDIKGIYWHGLSKYTKTITTTSSSAGGKRVSGKYMGGIGIIRMDGKLLLFHVMCESEYFKPVWEQTETFIKSLQFKE